MSDRPKDTPPPDAGGLGGGSVHGHFRIIEPIGHGGMGIVYKAVDTRLDRTVALKFLPPFLSADDTAEQRFLAEARAASALDHPNICTIHDIGASAGGQSFIAMAFYDGKTLKEKIAAGPLPLGEAVGYARQVANGLEKAHAAGIIHRDIKPANIMVTKDGIVKILDFGLAKLEDLGLTQSGSVPGTLKYMSPEHTEGDKVDQRTDLWSVGVILYEMLSGQHPFGSGRAASVAYAVLNEEPEPLSKLNPRVPEDVARIISGCLVKERDRRYQSATELLDDLDATGITADFVTGSTGVRTRRRGRRLSAPMRAALGVGAAAVLALSIPQVRRVLLPFGSSELRASTTRVAVLPLASPDGVTADSALAAGLTYSLTNMIVNLEGVQESLWVIPAEAILRDSVSSALEAHQLFGVTAVLGGVYQPDEGDGVVNLTLSSAGDDPRLLKTASFPGPTAPDFDASMQDALVHLLGLGRTEQVDEALARSALNSVASPYYLEGQGYLARRDVEGNIDQAIRLFERGLDEDPTFALAHAALCEARFEKFRQTREPAFSREALASCNEAAILASDQPAVLVSLGSVLLQTGELSLAYRRLEQARAIDPDDPALARWLGRYHDELAEDEQAEYWYRRAIELQPDSWVNHQELAVFFSYRDRLPEAKARYDTIRRLTPDNYLGYNGLGYTSLSMNQVDSAFYYFRESIARRENAIAYRNLGYLHIREGRWQQAIDELRRGLAINASDTWILRWLGEAQFFNGEPELARAAWQRLIDVGDPFVDVSPETDLLLGLAEAKILLGDEAGGRRHLDRVLNRDLNWNYLPFYIGRIYEMLDLRESALTYIERALAEGFDPVMVRNDPWLAPMRTEPRFVAAIEAAGG